MWMFTFCYVFVLMPGVFFVVGIFAGFFLLILKFIWHVMVLWEFLVGERKIGELEGGNCLALIKFHDWHWTRFTIYYRTPFEYLKKKRRKMIGTSQDFFFYA